MAGMGSSLALSLTSRPSRACLALPDRIGELHFRMQYCGFGNASCFLFLSLFFSIRKTQIILAVKKIYLPGKYGLMMLIRPNFVVLQSPRTLWILTRRNQGLLLVTVEFDQDRCICHAGIMKSSNLTFRFIKRRPMKLRHRAISFSRLDNESMLCSPRGFNFSVNKRSLINRHVQWAI